MKIILTPEIESFLDRCRFNLSNQDLNSFVGMHVTKAQEKKVQKELQVAGDPEFQTDSSQWPSLFLSTAEWEQSPYHSHVMLDMVKDDHFSYVTEKTAGRELFNVDAIQKDPRRELNDWMKLRAMDQNFNAIYLMQDDQDWMVDAPSEAATNDIPAGHAHGKVLTFGLGIGYFLYMALLNPNVTSVTVIEKSPQVIEMFRRFLLPQFPDEKKVEIICGDAFEDFNRKFLSDYDYVYTDIWFSAQDGLVIMEKLLEQYVPSLEQADFWIEDSCFNTMWSLIFLYFDSLAHHRHVQYNPAYRKEMHKIQKYFEQKDETIRDPQALKHYMYDNMVIRNILSLR